MIAVGKSVLAVALGLAGSTLPCSECDGAIAAPGEHSAGLAAQAADTATVRLHISGMTCGSCPTTARLALKRLTGVYDATVTLQDSLGVVRYDQARVTPEEITAHLTRLTGYRATALPDAQAPRKPKDE